MKDIVTPVTPEEVKAVVRKCLENAALVNYTRISQNAKVEGNLNCFFIFFNGKDLLFFSNCVIKINQYIKFTFSFLKSRKGGKDYNNEETGNF